MDEHLGMSEKEIIEFRKKKLDKIRAKKLNPYPSKSNKDHTCSSVLAEQKPLVNDEKKITIAGRLMAMRGHGKLVFADLVDQTGKVQIALKEDILGKDFDLVELIDAGDFVEVTGPLFVTKMGETTVKVEKVKILTKSLRPLPDKWHGIQDEEMRYRKRYLDILLNPDLRELFIKKAKFWQTIRNFMIGKGFLEVETPVLENTCGGADANPFVTHHDYLDIDVYLRISMGELWQKRLMVAGFDKTFELGRQFRNEGVSREHLQDYSQMEFYWAYANYEDSMALVEEMYKKIAKDVFGTYKFTMNGYKVDFDQKWEKIDYTTAINKAYKIDVLKMSEADLKKLLKDKKIDFRSSDRKGRLIDLLWKQIRRDIAGPAFLINHPVEVSPLAKRKEEDPRLTERYQVLIAGSENGNGYSELNDPIDQAERFAEQNKMREAGDIEAQMHDRDFVEALEYGMPPTTGFGVSERLFAFMVDKPVRECVMFPLLKPEKPQTKVNRVRKNKLK
ncbi:MAG: lysine--tRNA ligase [Patescibacteria group bacterium]|jgi:lysyl-tRNA synthetase class 2